MANRRVKVKEEDLPTIRTLGEAETAIAEIGQMQRNMQSAVDKLAEHIAQQKATNKVVTDELSNQIQVRMMALEKFADANQAKITDGGKRKSIKLTHGRMGWREQPRSVRLKGVDAIVEALKEAKLVKFLRTKMEVDKEAILKEPDAVEDIDGITVTDKFDEFFVEPDHEPVPEQV